MSVSCFHSGFTIVSASCMLAGLPMLAIRFIVLQAYDNVMLASPVIIAGIIL